MKFLFTLTEKRRKYLLYSLLVITLAFTFFIRLIPLTTSHWWDESVYLQNSEVLFSHRTNYNEFFFRPPLLPFVLALSYFFKHHIFTANMVVALLGTLSPLFIFFIGRRLYDETTGFIASLFMSFTPFLVENSHFIMTDVPAVSLLSITVYFLVRAFQHHKRLDYVLCGLFFSLSILMRFTSLILLFVIPVYFYLNKKDRNTISWFVFGFLIPMLPYFIWAQITQGFFLKPFIMGQAMVQSEIKPYSFYFVNFLIVYPLIILLGFFIWFIHFLSSIYKHTKEKFSSTNKKYFFDVLFILWASLFFVYMTIIPHKEPRYLLPLAIPLFLLSSQGLTSLLHNKYKWSKFLTCILLVVFLLYSFYPSFQRITLPLLNTEKTPEVEASEYLMTSYPQYTLLYSNNNYPVFAYYSGMKVKIIWPAGASLYSQMETVMPETGIVLLDKRVNKQPSKEFMDTDKRFHFVKKIDYLLIYTYDPLTNPSSSS